MNHLENAKKRLKDSLLNLEELVEARSVELRHYKNRCRDLEQENQHLLARLRELGNVSIPDAPVPANTDIAATATVQEEINLSISELKNFIGQKNGTN